MAEEQFIENPRCKLRPNGRFTPERAAAKLRIERPLEVENRHGFALVLSKRPELRCPRIDRGQRRQGDDQT